MGYNTGEWQIDYGPNDNVSYHLPWVRETNGFLGSNTAPTGDTPSTGIWKPSITGYYMVTARCGLRGASSQIKEFYLSMQRNYLNNDGETTTNANDWANMVQTGAHNNAQAFSHTEYPVISTIVQVSNTNYSYKFVARVNRVSSNNDTFPGVLKDFTVTGAEIYKFV